MKLSDFIFSYVKFRAIKEDPDYERIQARDLSAYSRNYQRYRLLLRSLDRLLSTPLRRSPKVNILFVGRRFLDLMRETRNIFNPIAIASGKQDRLQFVRYRIPFFSANKWMSDLFSAYRQPELATREKSLRYLVSAIQRVLKTCKPIAIIFGNDSLPLERAIICAAKECHIPSVTIQDGLFQSASDPAVLHGHVTDYMLVWGQYFKEMFISKEIIPARRIYVLGYPFRIRHGDNRPRSDRSRLRVCFLGQPFERFNPAYRAVKTSVIQNTAQACEELAVPLYYKLHPGERPSMLPTRVGSTTLMLAREDLSRCFTRYDIFFSMTSTALVEAALRQRMCAQIFVPSIPMDHYEKLGIAYTVPNSPGEIKVFVQACIDGKKFPFPVRPEYIFRPVQPDTMFVSIIEAIRNECRDGGKMIRSGREDEVLLRMGHSGPERMH